MKIRRSTIERWKRRLFIFLIVSIVASLFYVYFRTHLFTINSYELIGVPDMYKEKIEKDVTSLTTQKMYWFIPGNRVISYPSNKMKQAIVSTLPNTQSIKITPIGLHTLRVRVMQYEPIFKIDDIHGITKDGVIYTEFKDLSAYPKISFASSTEEEVVNDGIRAVVVKGVDISKLATLPVFINKINSVIFQVSKIEIDGYGDITLYDNRGMSRILFSSVTDIDKVWSNLLSAIDTDPLKSKLEHNKDGLEYLDARFGNKVFFRFLGDNAKFTNGKNTDIIDTHATTTATTTSH